MINVYVGGVEFMFVIPARRVFPSHAKVARPAAINARMTVDAMMELAPETL
jgi:hypothetical protein